MVFADRDDVDGQAQHSQTHSHRISYFKDFESVRSYDERIRKQDQHTTAESVTCWREFSATCIGDLRRRLSRRLSRQSATESPSRRRLVGDWSATQSPTSRHELFSKNIIPTYVRIVRRTSDRILLISYEPTKPASTCMSAACCMPNIDLDRSSAKCTRLSTKPAHNIIKQLISINLHLHLALNPSLHLQLDLDRSISILIYLNLDLDLDLDHDHHLGLDPER